MVKVPYLLLSLLPTLSYAYGDKVCYPTGSTAGVAGAPYNQGFSVTQSLNSEDNVEGAVIVDRASTTGSGSVPFTCECDDPDVSVSHWWSSQAMFPYTSDSQGHWQQITSNLEANVEMYVYRSSGGQTQSNYHSIPFIGISNNSNQSCSLTSSAGTGNRGTVTVRMSKPHVGNIVFSGLVAKVWHYRKPDYLNTSDPVMVTISLSLNISIPGGCTLLPGSTMQVELGNISQSDFSAQPYPNPPTPYSPATFDLKFDCDFAHGELDVVLVGNVDEHGQGYSTSHEEISVIIADSFNNVLPPNSDAGDVSVNPDESTSVLSLKAWPTYSGSGNAPTAGEFDATATIQLSYK